MDPNKPLEFNAEAPVFQPGKPQYPTQQPQHSGYYQQQVQSTSYSYDTQHQQREVYDQQQCSGYYSTQPQYPQETYNEHQHYYDQQYQRHTTSNNRGVYDQQRRYGNHRGYQNEYHQGYQNEYHQGHQNEYNQGAQNNDWRQRDHQQIENQAMLSTEPQPKLVTTPKQIVAKQSSSSKTSTPSRKEIKIETIMKPETEVVMNDAVRIHDSKNVEKQVTEDWEIELDVVTENKSKIEVAVTVDESKTGPLEVMPVAPPKTPVEEVIEEAIGVEELKGKYAKLKEPDPRPHLNVVFIGHVDAGKSTTCGNILFLTGQVDQRMIEKYEREAKEKNRDTWFFAFITDINEEERQKGKTVEVGRAAFELVNTRFTILDAPGHKSFVPNMIGGAAQADVAVLIISARKGEFETGFERGGQTREHAMLAKTLGVSQLVVAINKMDDPTCNWGEERYNDIEKKLTPFLRGCGYNPAKDITFVPISGLTGQNLKLHATDSSFKSAKEAAWYDKSKPTLFQILNNLKPPERNEKGPLRIPLLEGFRDQGVMAVGKVEAGTVVAGQAAILMPKRIRIQIAAVQINEEEVSRAKPGENVTLRVTGCEEDQITKGMILCSISNPCPVLTTFKAQVMIVELLEHRPLITAGYSCIIHAHTACEEVQLITLLEMVDKTTKKKKLRPQFVKGNSMVICEMQMASPICMEIFDERPQLGRFTLRDEGKTIAIGKVLEIIN